MSWKHWLLCQASALLAGYLAWSASGNPWIGGGVVVGTVVVYTFMLAGRGAGSARPSRPGSRASAIESPPTRQQRRAEARARRKRQSD
ncbi:MAG: hypothetical protein KIT81_11315 [Alphaproteobacteria bacterium]|nr:hypothetical protein [Alphaproteobacteria bacterium]